MKISTTIWDQDKLNKLFIYLRESENSVFRLFCVFFMAIIISGCNFWPSNSERELSISHRSATIPPGIDSEHIAHLLEVSKKRYIELKNAGAEYCLPGQMLKVTKKQNLIEHEIDGGLLLDARIHMRDLFAHLYNIKNQVENNNPSEKCFEYFTVFNKETAQELSVWGNSVDIDALMEDE